MRGRTRVDVLPRVEYATTNKRKRETKAGMIHYLQNLNYLMGKSTSCKNMLFGVKCCAKPQHLDDTYVVSFYVGAKRVCRERIGVML